MARARAARRGRRAARARLGAARARAAPRPGCCAAACGPTRSRARCGAPARASSTPTTSTPAFGWRALAAARDAGARVVAHLHQYRLVCAVGICFTAGARVHALPRAQHAARRAPQLPRRAPARRSSTPARSRSGSAGMAGLLDAAIVPSEFARERLRELGAPLPARPTSCRTRCARFAERSRADAGSYALFAAPPRAREGARRRDRGLPASPAMPLVVAGEGSERARFEGSAGRHASPASVDETRARRAARGRAARADAVAERRDLRPRRGARRWPPACRSPASDIGALPELDPARVARRRRATPPALARDDRRRSPRDPTPASGRWRSARALLDPGAARRDARRRSTRRIRRRCARSSPAAPASSAPTSSTRCVARGDEVTVVDDLSTGRRGEPRRGDRAGREAASCSTSATAPSSTARSGRRGRR